MLKLIITLFGIEFLRSCLMSDLSQQRISGQVYQATITRKTTQIPTQSQLDH
jgi:hypothetical protein